MASAASVTKTSSKDKKNVQLCAGASGYPGAKWVEFTYVYANTYASGGDPCDLTSTFPNQIFLTVLPPLSDNGAVIPTFDVANAKMKAWKAGSGSAAPAEYGAVDLSGATFKFWAFGY